MVIWVETQVSTFSMSLQEACFLVSSAQGTLLKRVQDSRRFLLPSISFVAQYWHVPPRFQFMGVEMTYFKDLKTLNVLGRTSQISVFFLPFKHATSYSVAFFVPSSENFNYHILVHKLSTGIWVFKPQPSGIPETGKHF